jgi:hypothetical protein
MQGSAEMIRCVRGSWSRRQQLRWHCQLSREQVRALRRTWLASAAFFELLFLGRGREEHFEVKLKYCKHSLKPGSVQCEPAAYESYAAPQYLKSACQKTWPFDLIEGDRCFLKEKRKIQ